MKFRVTFKTPDALDDAIGEAAQDLIDPGLIGEDREEAISTERRKVREFCKRWFRHGEHVTVEVDTEKETVIVLPAHW